MREWGDNCAQNYALVIEYVDLMLSPEEKQAMKTAKNEEGFPMGADPNVIIKLHKIAIAAIDKDQGNVDVKQLAH